MSTFKVGDLIKRLTKGCDYTIGKVYEVVKIDGDGDAVILDDVGDNRYPRPDRVEEHGKFCWSLENPEFSLKDLDSGMRVTCDNDDIFIIIKNEGGVRGYRSADSLGIECYDNFRQTNFCDQWKIKQVNAAGHIMLNPESLGEVLWKHEEPTQELTVAEIEAKLGYKVKVVK